VPRGAWYCIFSSSIVSLNIIAHFGPVVYLLFDSNCGIVILSSVGQYSRFLIVAHTAAGRQGLEVRARDIKSRSFPQVRRGLASVVFAYSASLLFNTFAPWPGVCTYLPATPRFARSTKWTESTSGLVRKRLSRKRLIHRAVGAGLSSQV
jgi:hypothetical protein